MRQLLSIFDLMTIIVIIFIKIAFCTSCFGLYFYFRFFYFVPLSCLI